MYVLSLESIFAISSGAKCGIVMHLFALESIYVISSGAKNDNVFTYFGFNHCNI